MPKPKTPEEALAAAIEAAGSRAKLAAALGVTRQGVFKWSVIPDRFATTVEKLYKIPRTVIAPHLFE